MIRAADAGEVLDLSRRGNNVVRATVIRDLLRSGNVDPRGLLLVGARVTGVLDLSFISTSTALQLDNCVFEEHVLMHDAELPALSFEGSTLPELRAENLRTRYLNLDRARFSGMVDLENARIDGSLLMSGASATRLFASGLHVSRSMTATGLYARQIVLDSCDIGGELNLRKAVVVSESGVALIAYNGKVGADIELTDAFVKSSDMLAVQLFDAKASSLRMNGAVLRGTSALCLDGATFAQDVLLGDGFDARSTVDTITMIDTRIGAALLISGSVRSHREQPVVLHRTKVGARVTITYAQIDTNSDLAALDLTDSTVNGALLLHATTLINRGSGYKLDLTGAKVSNQLCLGESDLIANDDFTVRLDGLTYPNKPDDPDVWLRMLRDHTLFYEAQPYQQLAAVHRAAGHEHDARKALIAQQNDLRQDGDPGNKLWHWFLGVTLGYGYQPSRAVTGLLVTFLLAIGLVWTVGEFGGLTPAKDRPADSCSPVNRISLAADLAIPLVKLGGTPRCELANGAAGQWATGAGWVVQILGWSFATLSVAGFTGLVRKN
ncbi:hypothetical protein LX88_001433 [Lentzea californiensis]|nr:hypothetical protein [Lentzea californiensis]